jgi:hypothetical protein
MKKPTGRRVLLITGSHINAFDFDLLLERLHRAQDLAEGRRSARRSGPSEQETGCGTWVSDGDLAPAREFIARQHGSGEPWFCYVNPRFPAVACAGGRPSASPRRAPGQRPGRAVSRSPKSGRAR